MSGTPPKKYVKINGVMKLNPEYKKYQESISGGAPATTVARPDVALPVVSNMDDFAQFNEDMGTDTPLSESTNAAIEMMQEPEICVAAGSTWQQQSMNVPREARRSLWRVSNSRLAFLVSERRQHGR